MSREPYLVILAAGMGSRYGGLKQIDAVDDKGNVIIDYSIYDAIESGFKNIVFIIKKSIEEDFKNIIGNRIEKKANVYYVYQEVEALPEGYAVPEGREKPWGTGHSIIQLKDIVDAPFAVINADDYYGKAAYKYLYDYLTKEVQEDTGCMIGYILENTVSKNGHVARGVCVTDENELKRIDERKKIEVHGDKIEYEDNGEWISLPNDSVVSMNMWGFNNKVIKMIEDKFTGFLDTELDKDPLKCEFLLPEVIQEYLKEGKLNISVIKSTDKWFGVTYKEDKAGVVEELKKLREKGLYDNI